MPPAAPSPRSSPAPTPSPTSDPELPVMRTLRVLSALSITLAAALTAAPAAAAPAGMTAACADRSGPYAHCLTYYRALRSGARSAAQAAAGWGATDLRAAYQLPDAASTATVAVSIAFDAP